MTPSTPKTRPIKGPPRTARRPTIAQRADPHDLYQRAVQCVEAEIDFVDETFKSLRNRRPVRLREDFCGTANSCCEWVRRRPGNRAVGLDIDPAPLSWGRTHNLSRLRPAQRGRLRLEQTSVLEVDPADDRFGNFDVILAMNFSYFCFKQRATMLNYCRRVRECLGTDGVFFMDFFGGADSLKVMKERRPLPRASKGEPAFTEYKGPFTYIWDHAGHDPITGDMDCRIHFAFPDGTKIKDAFRYDWRFWTMPELRDILLEAGFRRVTVYWEGDDGKGGGDGVFTAQERGETCDSFVCYITGEK